MRYRKMIIEATGCTTTDAAEVEQLMRDQYGTLDHLSRMAFIKSAKLAHSALVWSRTPEGIEYQKLLEKEFYGA